VTATDQYGLALSTESVEAAEAYVEGLELSLRVDWAAASRFSDALQHDPGFALARAAIAFHLQFEPDPALAVGQALVAATHARDASPREQRHVEIVRRAAARDWPAVGPLAIEHLAEYPRDVLVLWQLQRLHGYGGDPDRKAKAAHDLDGRVADWGADPWFLALRSLALSEVGRLDEAEQVAGSGLAAAPDHTLLAHSWTHVAFERGDDRRGRDELAAWLGAHSAGMADGHLRWHVAISDVVLGEPDAALGRLRSGPDMPMHDAASLLWRLHLRGIDVIDDMAALVDAPVSAGINNLFDRAHLAVVHCVLGDSAALDRMLVPDPASLADRVFVAWVHALRLIAGGQWHDAVPRLERVAAEVQVLGGSNEQHGMVHETLATARRRLPA
jgi:hypothetical protein